ncbi:MAG: cytochrome P450 [Acidimicrobiia bacterium]|nr:cytochrome P450 [Acidimicrobiia bacterium]
MSDHPPVRDWENDFDHVDPAWSKDPFPIWDELRSGCPVAHSDRYGGVWLPTRHADVSQIAYDTEHFTSQGVVVSEGRPEEPRPIGGAPPITSDPPFHALARRLLLPAFAPKAVAALEGRTRDLCRGLLAGIGQASHCDGARDYAQHIPVGVIAHQLGLPIADAELFRHFVHGVLETVDRPPEEREQTFAELENYLDDHIAARGDDRSDDLIDYLLHAEIAGNRLQPEHVRGTALLLLIAGIDTTWSAIGASLWHLAGHPDDQRRLRAEPELMDSAVEEFLRAYAPVTMARLVAEPVDVGGRSMQPGEWVLLPFPAANRDPAHFERPDEVLLDRAENRHAAFGLGIHRCVGSNLARMEVRVALEEFLAAMPPFALADPDAVTWSVGQVRGPRSLPLVLSR